jgi:hypothetical protein
MPSWFFNVDGLSTARIAQQFMRSEDNDKKGAVGGSVFQSHYINCNDYNYSPLV